MQSKNNNNNTSSRTTDKISPGIVSVTNHVSAMSSIRLKQNRGRPRTRPTLANAATVLPDETADEFVFEAVAQDGEVQLDQNYRAQRAAETEQLLSFFAQRLRQLRLEYGYSQVKLGQLAQVSISLVSRLEAGAIMPTLQTAQNIAAAFGLSVSQLVEPESARQPVSIEDVDEEVVTLLGQLSGRPWSAMTRRLVWGIVEQILADNEQARQE